VRPLSGLCNSESSLIEEWIDEVILTITDSDS
jgi:hypothetical protein